MTVFTILLVVVLGGGGTETAGSDPGGPTAPEEPGEPEQEMPPAPMGQSVEVGNVAWEVTNAEQATQLSTDYGESKRSNFVIVAVNFQNNGNEAPR